DLSAEIAAEIDPVRLLALLRLACADDKETVDVEATRRQDLDRGLGLTLEVGRLGGAQNRTVGFAVEGTSLRAEDLVLSGQESRHGLQCPLEGCEFDVEAIRHVCVLGWVLD